MYIWLNPLADPLRVEERGSKEWVEGKEREEWGRFKVNERGVKDKGKSRPGVE